MNKTAPGAAVFRNATVLFLYNCTYCTSCTTVQKVSPLWRRQLEEMGEEGWADPSNSHIATKRYKPFQRTFGFGMMVIHQGDTGSIDDSESIYNLPGTGRTPEFKPVTSEVRS